MFPKRENLLGKFYDLKCFGIIGDELEGHREFHFLNSLI